MLNSSEEQERHLGRSCFQIHHFVLIVATSVLSTLLFAFSFSAVDDPRINHPVFRSNDYSDGRRLGILDNFFGDPATLVLKSPLLTDDTKDEWTRELLGRLDAVRKKCGALCSINDKETFDKYLVRDHTEFAQHLAAPVNCRRLFEMEEIDAGDVTFPEKPPKELEEFYTIGGLSKMDIGNMIYRQQYMESTAEQNIWTEEEIENRKESFITGQSPESTYGTEVALKVFQTLSESMDLVGKSVLVIGSENPWLESAALAAGAAKVTTLEYGSIDSRHPQIETMTPNMFRSAYLNGEMTANTYDSVLTFSSLEHAGLGRYGDALNPWGDILSLARAWCVTKDDGSLMVDVPSGADVIQWNANRLYGQYRWPLLTINWAPLTPMETHVRSFGTRLFKKVPQKR